MTDELRHLLEQLDRLKAELEALGCRVEIRVVLPVEQPEASRETGGE